MILRRGDVWWADLRLPRGSTPVLRRPVVVVSADFVNRSEIRTVSVVGLTSNVRWAGAPGNVLIAAGVAGLPQESVANVTQLQTLERSDLNRKLGKLPRQVMRDIDAGLRRVLDL